MMINEILQLLVTYGTPLVITAAVLYGGYRVMNIYIDRLSTRVKREKLELDGEHDKLLEVRKSIDKHIHKALERVLMRTNSDRVFIFELHNGEMGLGGLPFLKMTNTYEVCDVGIKPQKFHMEQMSLSMYHQLISTILEEAFIVIDVHERDAKVPGIAYETMLARNTHKTIFVRITDTRGRVIGFIGVDYCKPDRNITGQSCIKLAQELATEMGGLLSVHEDMKK
jgi:hypothetical protein